MCFVLLQFEQTPLYNDLVNDHVVVIEYLLDEGSKIDHKDKVRYLMYICSLKCIRYNHMCTVYTVYMWDKSLQYVNDTIIIHICKSNLAQLGNSSLVVLQC